MTSYLTYDYEYLLAAVAIRTHCPSVLDSLIRGPLVATRFANKKKQILQKTKTLVARNQQLPKIVYAYERSMENFSYNKL